MKRVLCLICVFASYAMLCASAGAETALSFCVNEMCSSNGGHYTIEGNAPDYVELRNLTDQAVLLDGFFISNDEDHLQKFSLNGYSIPESGYIILAADKKELPFKLSASGGDELFLSDADGNVLQRVSLPPLEKDETYSLQQSGEWQLTDPTPLEANGEGIPYVEKVYVASPRFSHEAGFYDDPFDLTLEGYKTYQLYYTTDGSVPDENAALYTGPIHIEDATNQPNTLSMRTDIMVNGATAPSDLIKKATIIRAVAIDPDGNRSNVVTNTYFVGFQNYEAYQNIAVLSIVADPYDLFDEQDGIYVRGKTYQEWLSDENRDQDLVTERIPTNYKQRGKEWEIPVDIQWFDAENLLQLSQGVGLRIHGDWSRENAKKSFNLYARKEYGASTFQYGILAGLTGKEKLVVRTNLARDSLLHALLQETGLPVSLCTPCLTFINGEFWGLYEIRDKQDVTDIASFFGLKKEDLIVVKNQELAAGTTPDEIEDKSSKGVHKYLVSEISKIDASTPKGYEAIDSLIDVDNYITQIAGNAFLNNTDTSYRHNFTIWRTAEKGSGQYEDGRWRWIFQDMDMCCYSYEGVKQMILSLPEDMIFNTLWKSSAFQTKFLTRIMDFANVELTPEYVQEFISPILTSYDPYLRETYVRFPGKNSSVNKPGTKEISTLMSFFKTRRDAVIQQLTETFKLTRGTSTISLTGLTDGIALEINGHQAHIYGNSWTGVYFKGCTVSFTAGDIPGYQFAGWYEDGQLISEERTLEVSTDDDRMLSPAYEELPSIAVMNASEIVYGSGRFGFTIPIKDSLDECSLQPDASVEVERSYVDNSILFRLDASVEAPQGFTLSLPMRNYLSGGGVFTLTAAEASSSFSWKILCKTGEKPYQELAVDRAELPGGLLRLSFVFPEEQLEHQSIDIRLETEAGKGDGSFTLRGFRLYGVQMEPSLAQAHEYARVLNAIGVEPQYYPDFERMDGWSAEEVEAEVASLRDKLQSMMAGKALSTVGALGISQPAWEGLDAYPAIVIDEKLIEAFYDKEIIDFNVPIGAGGYLYEAEKDTLRLKNTAISDSGVLSLRKRAGTFFLLDKPVEEIRYRASFDRSQISDTLLSTAFFDIPPYNYLWMTIETFTRYQEEVSLDLPEIWFNKTVFVYRLQGNELALFTERMATDGTLWIQPAEGRYLLLDESVESFAEQADWIQKELAEEQRLQEKEARQRAKMKKTFILLGCAVFAVIAVSAVIAIILQRKRK